MKHRAFSLTEMIIAIVLLAVVSAAVFMLIKTPGDFNLYSQKEFDVQSDLRYSSSIVDSSIKNASAAFLLTKHDTMFKKGWNYFMNEEEGGYSRLLLYEWDGTGHVKKILSEFPSDNVVLKLYFQRKTDGGMIKYNIEANDKKRNKEYKVESEVKVLNAANIIDESKLDYSVSPPEMRANCLAFRSDKRDPSVSSDGYDHISVSFVLDTSGSMDAAVDGGWATSSKKSRIKILKEVLTKFMEDIVTQDMSGVVDVRIYPFASYMAEGLRKYSYLPESEWDNMVDDSTSYNNYDKFINAKKRGLSFLKKMVNDLRTSNATNPADGLRYAYHGINQYEKIMIERARLKGKSKVRIKHYLFLLTDGVPNRETFAYLKKTVTKPDGTTVVLDGVSPDDVFPLALPTVNDFDGYERENGYVKNTLACNPAMSPRNWRARGYVWAGYDVGSNLDQYIKLISGQIKGHKTPYINESIEVTVVGFSSRAYDNQKCNMMGRELGAAPVGGNYYKACDSDDALKAVFKGFTENILADTLWYVSGPQ